MNLIVIRFFQLMLVLFLSLSCLGIEDKDARVWIDENYPKENYYEMNKALNLYVDYYEFVISIDLDSDGSIGQVSHAWSLLNKASNCSYFVAYRHLKKTNSKRFFDLIREESSKIEDLVLNTRSKRKKYFKVDQEFAGYSSTMLSIDRMESFCSSFVLKE